MGGFLTALRASATARLGEMALATLPDGVYGKGFEVSRLLDILLRGLPVGLHTYLTLHGRLVRWACIGRRCLLLLGKRGAMRKAFWLGLVMRCEY